MQSVRLLFLLIGWILTQGLFQSKSAEASTLLGLLGVVLGGVAVPIGITCTPISVRKKVIVITL